MEEGLTVEALAEDAEDARRLQAAIDEAARLLEVEHDY